MQSCFYIDGKRIQLRKIHPDDEQLWIRFLSNCSKESIYSRFHYFFYYNSIEIAHNFCCLNNQKEIAIVAELAENDSKEIIGIGRLISDLYHETAEYAILISDLWQHKSVGSHLTDYCLAIAKDWGIKKLMALVSNENVYLCKMLKKRGFKQQKTNQNYIYKIE